MTPRNVEVNFGPVFPVLPSYTSSGDLDLVRTAAYVSFLHANGAASVMTTAGTSQFNLMTAAEILSLNECVAGSFPGRIILGAPALSETLLIHFLLQVTRRSPLAELLVTYPERLYSSTEMVHFFQRLGRALPPSRIHIHGLPMRSGRSGTSHDFTGSMILAILDAAPQVIGMKEESSTYEAGFSLCATLSARRDFELIVAGGSMRRFLLLQAAGAQSFFSGIGSLFPEVEVAFFQHMGEGRLHEASQIISEIETPFFEVFMDVGWHKSLRHAAKRLDLIGDGERLPMTGLCDRDARRVDVAVGEAQRRINALRQARVL